MWSALLHPAFHAGSWRSRFRDTQSGRCALQAWSVYGWVHAAGRNSQGTHLSIAFRGQSAASLRSYPQAGESQRLPDSPPDKPGAVFSLSPCVPCDYGTVERSGLENRESGRGVR